MRKIRFGHEKCLLSVHLYTAAPSPAFIDGNFKPCPGCTTFKDSATPILKEEKIFEHFATQPDIVNFNLHKQGTKEILPYK